MDWYNEEEKPLSDVTVAEVEKLCELIAKKEDDIEALKEQIKSENIVLLRLQKKAIAYLTEFKKKNYQSAHGTIGVVQRFSVAQPKTPEKRNAFFAFLKERGIFEELVSVNSKTLTSFYREEMDAAREENRPLEIPGLDEPSYVETLSLKRGKNG